MESNHKPVKVKSEDAQPPAKMSKKTIIIISSVAGGIVLILFIALIAAIASSYSEFSKTYYKNKQSASAQPETSQAAPTEVKTTYPFDIPALLTKDIDQIRQTLGAPSDQNPDPTPQQTSLGVDEWDNTFEKEGEEILVTFNSTSRVVIDIFVSGTDKQELIEKTGLSESTSGYKLEFVDSLGYPGEITGMIVSKS